MTIFDLLSGATALAPLYEKCRAYQVAKEIEGVYYAKNYEGRQLIHMDGSSATWLRARPFWALNSHILDVVACDSGGAIRRHHGTLEIDPKDPTRAKRKIAYEDSDEFATQQVEIREGGRKLILTPEQQNQGYKRHALVKAHGILGLN